MKPTHEMDDSVGNGGASIRKIPMTTSIDQILSEFREKSARIGSIIAEEWGSDGKIYADFLELEIESFLTSKLTEYGQEEYMRGRKEGREDALDYVEEKLGYETIRIPEVDMIEPILEAARKGV